MGNRVAFLLSSGLALLAAVLLWMYLRGREAELLQLSEPRPVIVTAVDLQPNTVIEETHITRVAVPAQFVQPGALTTAEEVIGRVAVTSLPRGAQVLGALLSDAGQVSLALDVPRGLRAVAISVGDAAGAGGLIRPGNFVDVIGTFQFGRPTGFQGGVVQYADEKTEVRTLMQNIPVVAVNRTMRRTAPRRADAEEAEFAARPTEDPQMQTVTVLVQPDKVQELILAQEIGTVTLSLRSTLDQTTPALSNLDPLGLLKVQIPVKPKAGPTWRDVGRGLFQ